MYEANSVWKTRYPYFPYPKGLFNTFNIVKVIRKVPVIQEGLKRKLDVEIIHTGQHYDHRLSQIFFEEFELPDPKVNLEVSSGSHAYQTGEIMLRLERCRVENAYSLVLIPGDTNSTLAGALTSVKLGIPVAHIEAGARCYDMKMAEEINRRLIDHYSKLLFAPTLSCKKNLRGNRSSETHI
jgi:UDP-N-acetylglucosamine 2-epimerase